MKPGVARVDVIPSTVHPLLESLRETARTCVDTASQLTSSTPVMPPRFFARWHPALGMAAVALRGLAAELDGIVLYESWRLAWIELAGGGGFRLPLGPLAADVSWAARLELDRIRDERGFNILADPEGPMVHAVMGEVDVVVSLLHTATVLLEGTPLYGTRRPGGREARHELVAMGINLSRLSPLWMTLEPEDSFNAYMETLGRVVDVQDLQSGDIFRWGGHMGLSALLARGADGLVATRMAGATEEVVMTDEGWKGATRTAYNGVSEANKLPPGPSRKARSRLGREIGRQEDAFGRFLETAVP